MTEEQRYLFDAFGYLIVPDAVTGEQIEELRSTLRVPSEQLDSAGRSAGPLHWSRAWRDLLDLPALSPILEEMIGNHDRPVDGDASLPTFRIDHVNVHTHVRQGFPGGMLHGGWKTAGGSQFFRYHDGRFFNGLVAVAFELHDTNVNGGGFCCIPGTHKANLPLPAQWQDLSKGHPSQRAARAGAAGRRDRVHRGAHPRDAAVDGRRRTSDPVLQVLPARDLVERRLLRSRRLPPLPGHGRPQDGDPGTAERALRHPADASRAAGAERRPLVSGRLA